MGKVVTSQGLQEFVQSGKVEHVQNHKPDKKADVPPPEVKKDPPTLDVGAPKPEEKQPDPPKAETHPAEDEGLDPEDKDLSEQIRRKIGKKHRAMKEAQEAAADAERFAESQYNERRLADQRIATLEARNKELEDKAAPKAKEPELKAPSYDDKDAEGKFLYKDPTTGQVDWDKYTDAKADYAAKNAVAEERQRLIDEKSAEDAKQIEKRTRESADRARKAHPDFDDVMSSVKGTEADRVPQYMLNYLSESEHAGELAYYLAKNPEDTARIAKLSPIRGLAEMGKLEDRLVKPPEKPVPPPPVIERGGPPAPITPLSGEGTAGINTDPAKMSYKELRAYEKARMKPRN